MMPLHEVFKIVKLTEPENRMVLPGARVGEIRSYYLMSITFFVTHDE